MVTLGSEPAAAVDGAAAELASDWSELGITVSLRELPWPAAASADTSHTEVETKRTVQQSAVEEPVSQRRALVAECAAPWRSLSWAIVGGGRGREQRYVCAEVRNADLPLGGEPRVVIGRFLSALERDSGVVALTSADIAQYRVGFAREGAVRAAALVTAGLANALRVGEPSTGPERRYLPDTINLACWVNVPLTFEAELEALSIITQARTLEVLEARVPSLERNGWATGTGTDCISLFTAEPQPAGGDVQCYAGMHTAVGRVLGRATRQAVAAVVTAWLAKAQTDATLPP